MARVLIGAGGGVVRRGGGGPRSGEMKAIGIGFEFVAIVLAGFALGYWADRGLGSYPRGTLIGGGVALVCGLYQVVRQGIRLNREMDGGAGGGARSGRRPEARDVSGGGSGGGSGPV